MRRSLCVGVACCVLLLVVLSVPVRAAERPASEHQKIEALIQHVEHLPDAVCIRNNFVGSMPSRGTHVHNAWRHGSISRRPGHVRSFAG